MKIFKLNMFGYPVDVSVGFGVGGLWEQLALHK